MIGLKIKDISKDILTLFVICYEYSMSFTNTLKLFNMSRKYFWTFLEVCHPMIKMGVRKAANIKRSVDNILPYLQDREEGITNLSVKDDKILEAFSWFLEDSFTDGETCFHISQVKNLPFVKAFGKHDLLVASNYENMVKNLDRISYITVGDNKLYKTSRFLYFMEKYSGDTDISQLNKLSVIEMKKKISEGERILREKEQLQNR